MIILKDYFTEVQNEFIKGDDYKMTPKELAVITILMHNMTNRNIVVFNLKWLYDNLGISINNTYNKKEIKNILNGFIEDKIFIFRKNIYINSEKIITMDNININDLIFGELIFNDDNNKEFTMITDEELLKIKEYSNNNSIDGYGLLSTCLYILSCINMNEEVEDFGLCYPSIHTLSDELNKSENTILKYINILKELKILIFDYSGFKILSDGKIRNDKMFYTRYKDENILINRLNKEREEKGFIKISKKLKDKSNLRRSLKQKINLLEKEKYISLTDKNKLELLKEEYNNLEKNKEER